MFAMGTPLIRYPAGEPDVPTSPEYISFRPNARIVPSPCLSLKHYHKGKQPLANILKSFSCGSQDIQSLKGRNSFPSKGFLLDP